MREWSLLSWVFLQSRVLPKLVFQLVAEQQDVEWKRFTWNARKAPSFRAGVNSADGSAVL